MLRDVLPAGLDVATFRPIVSSHPCDWQILEQNRLEVLFAPISLPDSNANEPASHGYFTFEINQLADLTPGTDLENTAHIVFDYNPPITTNTVQHRIGQLFVKTDEPAPQFSAWQVLGNPTRDVATFRTLRFVDGEKQFMLTDAGGRVLQSALFSGQSFDFHRGQLQPGLYFFKIETGTAGVFSGKIVVSD